MAQVYQRADRGKAWYVEFRWRGKRYRECAGPAEMKKSDAEQYLAKRKVEVAQEQIYGPKPEAPVLFGTFADDFLKTDSPDKRSKDRDEGVIEMLKVQWAGLHLGAITMKMIEDYKAKRMRNRAPATVARELQVIKRLFKKAAEWGKIPHSPAAPVKKPRVNNGRVRFLEPDEIKRLMVKLADWLLPVAIFCRFTGARRGEAINLTWNDVDAKRGIITLRETKNGEYGRIRMNETVRALLASLPRPIDRSQRVFGLDHTPATWGRIYRAWRAACRAAKITDFHFHDLRHQAATDLLTLGAGINDVRDFLRHKSMSMTLRYAHLIGERQEQTARLLDSLGGAGTVGTKAATGKRARR